MHYYVHVNLVLLMVWKDNHLFARWTWDSTIRRWLLGSKVSRKEGTLTVTIRFVPSRLLWKFSGKGWVCLPGPSLSCRSLCPLSFHQCLLLTDFPFCFLPSSSPPSPIPSLLLIALNSAYYNNQASISSVYPYIFVHAIMICFHVQKQS